MYSRARSPKVVFALKAVGVALLSEIKLVRTFQASVFVSGPLYSSAKPACSAKVRSIIFSACLMVSLPCGLRV
jgi:hypothetical protein